MRIFFILSPYVVSFKKEASGADILTEKYQENCFSG